MVLATASVILAGPIGEQVATAPPQSWYADTECQLGLSGIYAFGSGDSYRTDRYLGGDNSWGGSVDAKYFFHRYFGLGSKATPWTPREKFRRLVPFME